MSVVQFYKSEGLVCDVFLAVAEADTSSLSSSKMSQGPGCNNINVHGTTTRPQFFPYGG